jgi:hypothetical protein
MAKVPLKTLTSGYFSTQLLNDNFDKIEQAIDNALTRDGTGPNEMLSDLDMNGNEIYNLGDPTMESSLATKGYVDTVVAETAEETLESAAEFTNTAVSNALSSLNQELIEGDVKTVRYSTVAYEGQTSFVVPFSGFKVAEVYVNGVHQSDLNGAYTVTNTTFNFAQALSQGDIVFFVLGVGYEIEEASNVSYELYTATEGQTDFQLTYTPIMEETLLFINGVKQVQNSYLLNLDTIVLSEGLSLGDVVEVVRINRIQKDTEYHSPVALFKQVISSSIFVPSGYNAMSVEPVLAEGVQVSLSEGSVWAVL